MNIALIGYGKMGKTIEQIAISRGHKISLIVDKDNLHDLTPENLKHTDVAIEFTNPESAVANLTRCFEAGVPVVCGTTGWLHDKPHVEKVCAELGGGFIYASNFSLGVNIFFEINKLLARLIGNHPQYEVSITEVHHTAKLDAPSGTAITLAQQVLAEVPNKSRWVNQHSNNPEDLVIHSLRIDPAPGTHTVTYSSEVDDIEIKHTAHNRSGFALGAVLAAEFLAGKKGMYTMREVLGM
ncbi:MAG: 4-hydroxy-tetrahydrodipicolinate reductase [Chitinophagaceae bacterium]|jgi:4-hydroxy-tetrahydrodipicolinate reductase|nr:4-hydroxy-tetrahydrodipicolinate reductase [Chitinophagaceae bacterium]